MRHATLLALTLALALLVACGGGGGGGVSTVSGIAADLPALQPSRVLSGIENLVPTNGRLAAKLVSFTPEEEAVVVVTSRLRTANRAANFSVTGTLAASAPPAAAPAAASRPARAPESERPADRRFRTAESLTARHAASHGGFAPMRAPRRAPARAIAEGETATFWTLNSLNWPPSSRDWTLVTATCRAVGERCYLFEDDTTPARYRKFPAEAWPILRRAFDEEIYGRVTGAMGDPPLPPLDADGDPRVFVLFTAKVNQQGASGYFDSTNELTQAEADRLGGGVYKSNEREILYMQVPSSTFDWGDDLRHHLCGVMAHEFLHMIVYHERVMKRGSASNEEDWLNEGLAQLAQDVSGYGVQHGTLSFVIEPFLDNPGAYSLTNFSFSLGQYGLSYLYARYLADHGVAPRALVQTERSGIVNVEAASRRDFDAIFTDFSLALTLSGTGRSADPAHAFTTINLHGEQADGTRFRGPDYSFEYPSLPFATPTGIGAPAAWPYGVHFIRVGAGSGGDADILVTDLSNGEIRATVMRFARK